MSTIWSRGLVAMAITAVAAAIADGLFGPVGALLTVSAVALAWGVSNLDKMAKVLAWAQGPVYAPVPDARGSWSLIFEALHRRTKVRAAEQRDLTRVIERFRTAAEALPDGMVILDEHNCIAWCNPRAHQHLGINAAKDLGQPLANIVRQPEFVHYLEEGEFSEPVVFHSSREQSMTLSVQIVPYGEAQRLLMSRDITRLEEVSRMRRDFIANVSHELKTPLTVLSGFLETVQEVSLDEPQARRYNQLMQEQARSMQRLVDDLLTLSSLESDDNRLREEWVDVEAVVTRARSDAMALSGGHHEIRVDIATRARLRGNRFELASAVTNLASNAVRYTPAGGTITLAWQLVEGEGRLSVADTGIGIAEEHIPRLTERFYRVDRSRSRATGGTGLGLAIVKHILLRHQAQLEIASEPGRGSTFTARFPAERIAAPAPVPSASLAYQ